MLSRPWKCAFTFLLLLATSPLTFSQSSQRTLNCSTVNSQSTATFTANDIMSRIVACVNLLGANGGGIADARDMSAFGSFSQPANGTTFVLGASNVTLLLGNYTISFANVATSTTVPLAIANVTNFSIIGVGGGGRAGPTSSTSATVFDFSGLSLSATSTLNPAVLFDSHCTKACLFTGFRIKGNLAASTGAPLNGVGAFRTNGATTTLVLDAVDVTDSAGNGITVGAGGAVCIDCTVKNSYVARTWNSGIEAVNVTNFKALNNVVLDTAISVAYYPGPTNMGSGFGIHTIPPTNSATPSQYIVIKDNYVGSSATGTGASAVCQSTGGSTIGCNQGIQTDGSAHCTIADNYLINTPKESIAVTCTDVVVQGNHIYNQVWPIPASGPPGTGCISVFGSLGSSTIPTFNSQFVVRDNVCNVNVSTNSTGYIVQINNGSTANGNGFTDMSNGVISGNIGSGNFLSGLQLTMMDNTHTHSDMQIIVHDNSWISTAPSGFSTLTTLFPTSAGGGTGITGNFGWWGNRDGTTGVVSIPSPNMTGTPSVALTFSEAAHPFQESAAPPAATSIDTLWGDSSLHYLMMNPNNAGPYKVQGSSGTLMNGNLSQFDMNGFLVDSGILGTNVVQSSRNINTTSPLTGGGSLAADLTLTCQTAGASAAGCLTLADWNTFNGKAPTASPTFTTKITTPFVQVNGTTFTATGCSVSTLVGGATAGSYKSGTAGTCTVIVTMGGSATAANGWACSINDLSGANQHQTATSTTTATFSGMTASMDILVFSCTAY